MGYVAQEENGGCAPVELIRRLTEFNRKERFFLIGEVLGNEQFRLSVDFRKRLGAKLRVEVPEDSLVAMDYHLDWIAASLHLAAYGDSPGPHRRDPLLIKGNQEDVDLLVAYEADGACHVIMIEAKGVTPWDNAQFCSKMRRLRPMFEDASAGEAGAAPHLVLMSPTKPQRLDTRCCPKWALEPDGEHVPWLPLHLPAVLKKVVRCDEDGTANRHGDHWIVEPEKRARRER
jgi:hypothetical protein